MFRKIRQHKKKTVVIHPDTSHIIRLPVSGISPNRHFSYL